MGCPRGVPRLFRAVPGCSGGVPGMFRGVPGFTDTHLFPLLIEVACFVIKSAIIIFVVLLHKSTKVCLHL